MFEWLVEEMGRIKTNKFFLVDGPASPELRDAIQKSEYPLPPSYREFALKLGNAKLFRSGDCYMIQVYAGPRKIVADKGEILIQFGRTETSLAYFKEELLIEGGESPVFEWRHKQGIRQTAEGFEKWMKAKFLSSRRRYKKKDWEDIVKGPPPFNEEEINIVKARKLFKWRVVGIAPNGDVQFEVQNGSSMVLPYLSIGIRGKLRPPKDGPLNGGVWLPVSTIQPGETRIIEKDCYKDVVDPCDIEAFEDPDPQPEDRDRYWEFRKD